MARDTDAEEPDDDMVENRPERCARCGRAKEDWSAQGGEGVEKGDILFCCEGCADNTGCVCEEEQADEESASTGKRRRL